MGNAASLPAWIHSKLVSRGAQHSQSLFDSQERVSYSKQLGLKCLEHLIDMSELSYHQSIKQVHKYIHPATKYLRYARSPLNADTEPGQFLKLHSEEIVNSATHILQMYCLYLGKVVPANISYFHFMREKDFYVHYSTLKYVMTGGQVGGDRNSSRNLNAFSRLSIETRTSYVKLISHWLYDMVKYKCSAIYIQSETLPHLIVMNAVVLCGLLDFPKANLLEQHKRKTKNFLEKKSIYEHTLYALTYILCESHPCKHTSSAQGNSHIQLVVLSIARLLTLMWRDEDKSVLQLHGKRVMYAPSYWYVEMVGYVKNPQLETVAFLVMLDLVMNRNKRGQGRRVSAVANKDTGEFQVFSEEIEIETNGVRTESEKFRGDAQESANSSEKFKQPIPAISQTTEYCYSPLNNLTHLMLYQSLTTILEYYPNLAKQEKLQRILLNDSQSIANASLIRPYLLELIAFLSSQSFQPSETEIPLQAPQRRQQVQVMPELQIYAQGHQMDYSTENWVVSWKTVGRNTGIYIAGMYGRVLHGWEQQLRRSDSEIWAHLLKYNAHEFKNRNK